MRTLAGAATLAAALAWAPIADGRVTVPTERVQVLARGPVARVGDELVRDSGFGDLLVAWNDGRRVRASIRPDRGRFGAPRTIPGLHDAVVDDSITEPFLGRGGHLLWGWRPGAGDTSRMLVANRLGAAVQPLATDPASVALGPLSREADVGPDGDAAVALVSAHGLAVAVAGPGGRFGAPQQLTTTPTTPVVRVGPRGRTLVAWTTRLACPGDPAQACSAVQATVRAPGGAFVAPATLDVQQRGGSLSQVDADVVDGFPVVWWRRQEPGATDSAIVLARGSDGGMAAPGAQLPGSDEPQTDGRCPPGPPGPLRIGHAPPRIVALRAAAAGGLFVLLRRDEGCGILLDEVGIDGDGNAGAPRRLNTVPLSRDDDGVTLLDRDSPRRSILVTKTTTGRVAVAGTPNRVQLGSPIPAPLPRGARLGAFGVLRDGAVAFAFSRPCAPGRRVSDVLVRRPGGPWAGPVRVAACGHPEPVLIDSSGRAIAVSRGARLIARTSAPVERYTRRHPQGGAQRSER